MTTRIITADVLDGLAQLEDESVQMCYTSPPYYALRDYGQDGQIGLEKTPEEYVAKLVNVFREVGRVLRKDGTLWLNLGDSYANSSKGGGAHGYKDGRTNRDKRMAVGVLSGFKPKDLIGIPWRVAFALQADGWWLRQDIIWHKPNPMPESVTDRCTKAHEYLFLLAKSKRYYYDHVAVMEPFADDRMGNPKGGGAYAKECPGIGQVQSGLAKGEWNSDGQAKGRTRRSVWTVATKPYKEAHFATFPPALIEPCIKAGSHKGDTVLDPFFGAGTTGVVCKQLGRDCIGIELNPEYAAMAEKRIADTQAQDDLF